MCNSFERVLWVNDKTDGGGAGKLYRAAARVLRGQGHSVAPFFGSFATGEVEEEYLRFQPPPVSNRESLRFLRRQMGDREVTKQLNSLVEYFRPTVIVIQNCHKFIGPHVISDARAMGIPTVLMVNDYGSYCVNCYAWRKGGACHRCVDRRFARGVWMDCSLRKGLAGRGLAAVRALTLSRAWRQQVYTGANAYFVAGRVFAERLIAAGFPRQKLVAGIYPHDVEIASSQPNGCQLPKFVFYGSELPIKGQEIVFDAVKQIETECEIVFLVLKDAATLERCASRVARENRRVTCRIDSRARWMTGVQDEIRTALAVLVPSTWESPHELVVYETMALGRAPIVTDCSSNAELVCNNKTGLVLPAASPVRLASALDQLVRAPELARSMGNEARRFYGSHLEPAHWLPMFLECVKLAKGNASASI